MHIIQSDSRGTNVLPIESIFLAKRKIWLTGPINTESALNFVKQLMYLVEESRTDAIDIYINSGGGEIDAGLMILDCLKSCPCEVNIYGMEMAASMAAIIMACGAQKGHRFLLPHSRMMIHEPLIAGGFGGSATEIHQTANSIMKMKDMIVDLLVEATGKNRRQVREAISYDHYLTALEAIRFGMADGVVESIYSRQSVDSNGMI